MAFCLSKPNAQDNLDSLWAVWNDTAKYELSDSFYHYLTETSYDTLVLELEQTLNSYYNELEIIHIILNKCIIDNKTYLDLPKDIKINNIKVDFKVICFPKKIISHVRNILNKINVQILNFFCTSYVKSLSYLRKLSLEKAGFLEIGYKRTNFIFYEKKKIKINSISTNWWNAYNKRHFRNI